MMDNLDPSRSAQYLERLAAAAVAVIRGDYRAATNIFELTRSNSTSVEGAGLAETFGLMTVKIEAREFALEQALNELRRKNADLETAAQLHEDFSRFFSTSILFLCSYSMLLAFLRSVMGFEMGPTSIASYAMNLVLFVMYCLMIFYFTRNRQYPMSMFGVTTQNWKRAVAESLLALVPVLILLVLVKVYLVNNNPEFAGKPIVDWSDWGPRKMWLIYGPSSVAQEFTTRGFQQTCIERLLTGKYRTWIAIILTSAQFAVVHLHYSFFTGMVAFSGGVFFGWLYSRHRTILGVSLIHYLVGQVTFGPLQLIH